MNEIAVIGLGAMGATLARLLLRSRQRVTVWNRSIDKAVPLLDEGATLAPSAQVAIHSCKVVIMCVYDYAAARSIWSLPGVEEAIRGRTLIHLSTGSPEDARNALAWATRFGARYLDGAIQAAPSQMGQDDTPILLSGDAETYAEVNDTLRVLAGNIVYLGESIDAAATMDMATLSYVYGAFAGFVHGARLTESQGLDVARFGQIVNTIAPSFGAFFQHEASVIGSGDFHITESPLRISIEATQRILDASHSAGINAEVPALFADLLQRAGRAGLQNEELAALIKVLRS